MLYEHWLIDNPAIDLASKEHFETTSYDLMEKNLEIDISKVIKGKDYYLDKKIDLEIKQVNIRDISENKEVKWRQE